VDILVVEDDTALREVMKFHLEAEGWSVREAGDGDAALEAAAQAMPDLVVLDIMIPKRTGLEVCTELRARFSPSPGVVMVTAKDGEVDVIMGFDAGADDYVIKPFRPRELVARVKALARRLQTMPERRAPGAAPNVILRGALRLECDAKRALVDKKPLKLTPTEYALLELLAKTPDKAYSRMELLKEVWDSQLNAYARNVDCHVTRLRRKLEAAGLTPIPIETVHGTGYAFISR
jgi:DNA-binding response OmpR family regulator